MLDSQETCERLRRLAPHAQVMLLPRERHFIRGQNDAVLSFLREA